MCGIAGVLLFGDRFGPAVAADAAAGMAAALAHRGPDGYGLWSSPDGRCHLGHRRLSIVDLTEAGAQPMADASGRFRITYNGEVYNAPVLRAELETAGARFVGRSDTEVLLEGFAREGLAFLDRVDGMFAAAVYDAETGRLTLFRDRAGEKPLYYAAGAGAFAFASELAPLLDLPWVDGGLSEDGVAHYFALRYVPAPATIVEGLSKLEPGCALEVEADGRVRRTRWFSFHVPVDRALGKTGFGTYCDALEQALVDALRGRLQSDVPLGVFLSSGIDSVLVAALLRRRLQVPVRSYCIGFEGDAESEHEMAGVIARYLDADHAGHVFSGADFEAGAAAIGGDLDEPNGDRSCVPVGLLSATARRDVTVALSGDGGDELFGGYGRYPAFAAAERDPAADPVGAVYRYFARALPVLDHAVLAQALPDGWRSVCETFDTWAAAFHEPRRPTGDCLRLLDFHTYMPGAVLPKVDRMSMRHGLEVRTPFYAPRVMQLAAAAPTEILGDGTVLKRPLRAILERHLPQQLVRRDKKGFGMPPAVFAGNSKAVLAELRQAASALAGTRFFQARPQALNSLMLASAAQANALWAFIVLGRWCARFGGRF